MVTGFPFMDFLNDEPEFGYYALANPFARSANQRRYFQGQYPDIYNQYKGKLGQQVLGGQEPTLKAIDFLKDYFAPGGGAMQQWAAMSPGARGEQQSRFAPPVRWLTSQRGLGGF